MGVNTFEPKGNLRTTDDTDRGHSSAIWHDCPIMSIRENNSIGIHRRLHFGAEGFKLASNVNAAIAYWSNGYSLFGSNGGAVATVAGLGGGINILSDGDDEGVSFQQNVAPLLLSRDAKKLWFEMRFKTSTIADTKHGLFMGLAEPLALSATVPIAAAGTLADVNFVGFHRLEGDGDMLDTVYKADGITQVTVKADAFTLVADTYTKIGMVFDPRGDYEVHDPNRLTGLSKYLLKFYANGRALADYKQLPSAAGTDFPNDVYLAPVVALLNATATTPGNTTIDWIEFAQLFTDEIPT